MNCLLSIIIMKCFIFYGCGFIGNFHNSCNWMFDEIHVRLIMTLFLLTSYLNFNVDFLNSLFILIQLSQIYYFLFYIFYNYHYYDNSLTFDFVIKIIHYNLHNFIYLMVLNIMNHDLIDLNNKFMFYDLLFMIFCYYLFYCFFYYCFLSLFYMCIF